MNQLYKNCNEVRNGDQTEKDWINSNAFTFWGSESNVMMWCYNSGFCFCHLQKLESFIYLYIRVSCYVFQCSIKFENTSCIYLLIFPDFYLIVMLNKNSTVKAHLECFSILKLYLAATPVLIHYHLFKV